MIFIFQNTKRHLVWQNYSSNENDSSTCMSQYGGKTKSMIRDTLADSKHVKKVFLCAGRSHFTKMVLLFEIAILHDDGSLGKVTNETNAILGIDQTHILGTFRPVRTTGTTGKRFGRNQTFEMLLDIFGHFGAQSTLDMGGGHVLGGLIQSHGIGWKVGGTLLTTGCR